MPAPLLWLLVAVGVLGLTWSFVTPAWQAPDEAAHFAYVQSLGERFELPGDPDRMVFSTEHALAASAVNADQVAGVRETKPEWSPLAYEHWRASQARLPEAAHSDGGGPNPAAGYPPLYYLFASVPYTLAKSGDIFDRILAVRISGVIWLLVVVVGAWLLAGELFRRDRTLQLAAASVAGLLPMVSFVSASVNPDGMLYAVWSVFLWLGVRALRRDLDVLTAAALAGVVGVGLVVKPTSYALLPGLALVLAVGLWRRQREAAPRLAAPVFGASFALLATVGVWTAVARSLDRAASGQLIGTSGGAAALNVKQLGGYLWQFYLPRLPPLEPFPSSTSLPVYDVLAKQSWGAFGWLEVGFPEPLYVVLAVIAVCVALAAAVALWRTRRSIDPWVAAFFAVVTVTLLAGLHWTEYHYVLGGNLGFMQGRYLFPLLGIAGAALAKALTLVPRHWRAQVVAGVMALLVALQLYGLGLVLDRYYA